MIPFDKAYVLLEVHNKASGYPQLKWLATAAMAELMGMESKPPQVEEPELPIEPKGRRV